MNINDCSKKEDVLPQKEFVFYMLSVKKEKNLAEN